MVGERACSGELPAGFLEIRKEPLRSCDACEGERNRAVTGLPNATVESECALDLQAIANFVNREISSRRHEHGIRRQRGINRLAESSKRQRSRVAQILRRHDEQIEI